MLTQRILLVEDDKSLREVLRVELQERGFEVLAFAHCPEVGKIPQVDFALLDLRVGSESSFDLLKELKNKQSDLKIVLMSGFGSVASAVKAMQLGAHTFLTKPVSIEMILRSFQEGTPESEALTEVPAEEISLARMEREYIDYVLQGSQGNISQAAKKLGLHRQSLQRKLRKNLPK